MIYSLFILCYDVEKQHVDVEARLRISRHVACAQERKYTG